MTRIFDYRTLLEEKLTPGELLWEEPMKLHTSFKIGGPADLFFMPDSVEHLKWMICFCQEKSIPFYIMGNGSNLLVGDGGYRGVIIQIYRNMNHYRIEGNRVMAEAGILLSKLANKIHDAGLTGFEFASGIPGTLGGAVYMNAGAYGGEMKDILVNATVINREGNISILPNEALDLGYRHSALMDSESIVLSAEMVFKPGDKSEIRDLMDDLNQRRRDKQPVEKPSAGSTFKRPVGFYAGKLVMDAGLRGYRIGDAQVSEKHCGFVVNTGEATAEEVLALIQHIQATVKAQFGVDLETEVRIIGTFEPPTA